MYTPPKFQPASEDAVLDFVRQHGFGMLVSHVEDQLWATHIPMVLSADGATLSGHVSRANKSWKDFKSDSEVLAVFQGPHAYISSSWYNHENVPTWNYLAAHVYGRIHVLEGDDLYQSLKELVDQYEAHAEHPVSVEGMSPEYLQREMRGIIGFQIAITRIEGTFKLSQNRDAVNHEAIIGQLEKRGDLNSQSIAEEMKKNKAKLFPSSIHQPLTD